MTNLHCFKMLLLLFVIFFVPVWGLPVAREADGYFEVKNYEKAIELYEKIAQDPGLEPWQIAAAQYNIGISYMDAGEWTEALKTLQQIQTASPLVRMHVNATLAYINLHLAQTQGVKDDQNTLNWLKDAIREVDEASKVNCNLQKNEGYQDCVPLEELVSLKSLIVKEWKLISDEGIGSEDPIETLIYMENAHQWIQRAIRLSTENDDPLVTLGYAIEDQEHALSINRLYKQLQEPSLEMKSLIKNAQKQTLTTAEPFYEQVLAKEKRDYPQQCQCHPWDKVIPSFEEGYKRAKWVLPVISIQEDILRYWKQSQENDTKQEEPAPKPNEEPQVQQSKIEEVLREIQTMDQDDKVLKPKTKISSEGIKPW